MRKLSLIGIGVLLTLATYAQKFDLGTINGANYQICIPDNWNQGLIMYAHGYENIGEETEEFEEEVNEFMEIFTSRGFAFAASAYKKQGLVIKDGIEDTEALRSYFEHSYGKPETCIITGHSMGGIITLATIEKYPVEYDGALPLCGWLAPLPSLVKHVLDMLVTYDYLFDENTGEIVTGKEFTDIEEVQKKLNEKPDLARLYAEHFRLKESDLAEVIDFGQYTLKETSSWLGGLPVGNVETIYNGFGDNDENLNRNIRRYHASPGAAEYFIQYHTPTGLISDPVLALHTTYDELVPVDNYRYYETATQIRGTQDLYAQQYVVRDGHCNFTEEETGEVLDKLLLWIREGKKPEITYY